MQRLAVAFALAALLPSTALSAGTVRSWAQPQIKLVTQHKLFVGTPATFRASAPLTEGSLARTVAKLTDAPARHPQNGAAPVSMEQLDRSLVGALGLRDSAYRFYVAARHAGLNPPRRFGTEVVARLLGLRLNHPAGEDELELQPQQTATRAEAAYSFAQILRFGNGGGYDNSGGSGAGEGNGHWSHLGGFGHQHFDGYGFTRHSSSATARTDFSATWPVESVKTESTAFALPKLSVWQRRIIGAAFSYIGYPYVWGGTGAGSVGFDCSGFVWRVYKLTSYPGENSLASMLRGRTTYEMSGEVPLSERIGAKHLQPGDVMFFGHGPNSKPAQVDHAAIYLGNGWLIQSSGYGVAVTPFDGWYRSSFAWGRRPLHEAGLT